MKKIYIYSIYGIIMLVLPVIGFAQGPGNFSDVYQNVMEIVNLLIPLLASACLLVFLWGLVKFIYKADNQQEVKKGKDLMIWGSIALFVMVSLWGIVAFLGETIGVGLVIPQFPE